MRFMKILGEAVATGHYPLDPFGNLIQQNPGEMVIEILYLKIIGAITHQKTDIYIYICICIYNFPWRC